MRPIEVGIIGAGAVTELCHLPAAQFCPEIRCVALADKNLDRALALAQRFNVEGTTADYHDLFGKVQAVIIALPHVLHAPVTIEFLEQGIPVLVEKPMALTMAEAQAMVETAYKHGLPLQVGHFMRFYRGTQMLRQALAEDWLGRLENFSLEWGFVYNWPVASGFFFQKDHSGGGALIDTGSHMLDLLLWWVGNVVDLVEYRDDSLGNVEAECSLSLILQSRSGPVRGSVTLSRLRKLANKARIVGARFTAEYDFRQPETLRIWPSGHPSDTTSFMLDSRVSPPAFTDVYTAQLRDFARVIGTDRQPVVPGWSALASVALIERCYQERQVLPMPWLRPGPSRNSRVPLPH